MQRECPYCNKKINPNGYIHIRGCNNNPYKENKIQVKIDYLNYNFPEISKEKILREEYITNNLSLPDLNKKYNIDSKAIQFLLTLYEIPFRNSSEAMKTITQPKSKIHYMKNFGVEWNSQLESVKEKKRNINLSKFGVDNIWKSVEFKNNLDSYFIKKYGITKSQWHSNYFNSKTPEEQRLMMINSALKSSSESTIEKRVKHILDENLIEYISQKRVSKFLFDICIGNILIEINGDYWHANPNKNMADDILKYPNNSFIKASNIWEKDNKKKNIANSLGYTVVYIWESFIKNSTDLEILITINEILNDKKYDDRNC